MPRYFFNVYDGKSVIDEDGMILSDIQQARRMAVRMAGQLFDLNLEHRMGADQRDVVTDESAPADAQGDARGDTGSEAGPSRPR
ncbi:DUF6894 family protein [Methylorubrum subtropicum]|uniref:DUF6894 family protein n=1 Tax=Methylorubrum subtropicum TaxID=3138812 RepID=UPI00399D0CC8